MAFFLFILVNGALFIRPVELFPSLVGLNLYLILMVLCLFAAIPDILTYFQVRPLAWQPITLCVLGFQVAILLPHLAEMDPVVAYEIGFGFFKIVLYFILFVSLVTTPQRLRQFTAWLLVFIFVLAALPALEYHGFIEVSNVSKLVEFEKDAKTGEIRTVDRLRGSGIFQDPNDLCVMLAAMTPLALFYLTRRGNVLGKVFWAGELMLFGYVILKTQSRGGMLALLAGLGAFTWARFGLWRTAALGALCLPALLLMGGRQTNFDTQRGTSQGRIQLWRDWMADFRGSPILGNGVSYHDEAEGVELAPEFRHAAHNSYLQAYADLGLVGGTLFLGAFTLAFWALLRVGAARTTIIDPELRFFHPYLLGMVTAYAVGMMSLTLTYLTHTFLILAMAAAFARMVKSWPTVPEIHFDGRVAGRLALASMAFLFVLNVIIRVFAA